MTVIDSQVCITHTGALQAGTGDISIDTALELIGTTLGDGVDATTRETTLTNVIGGDADCHLLDGIQ